MPTAPLPTLARARRDTLQIPVTPLATDASPIVREDARTAPVPLPISVFVILDLLRKSRGATGVSGG